MRKFTIINTFNNLFKFSQNENYIFFRKSEEINLKMIASNVKKNNMKNFNSFQKHYLQKTYYCIE